MFRYARLMHDFQLEEFEYQRRKSNLTITPETVTFNNLPREGKGVALRLSKDWYEFVRGINSELGFKIATGPSTGWVNEGWGGKETPLVQSLSMGGNVVAIRDVASKDFGRLLAFKGIQPPPDPNLINYQEAPYYIQKFTCISADKRIHNPGKNVDSFFPLIGAEELWVSMSRIEFFPEYPCKIQVMTSSFFRSQPKKSYFNVIGGLSRGQPVTLRGYAVRGSNVWGFISTASGKNGFVALLWYPTVSSKIYPTS